ncbi:hypothetical protein Poli38472_009588 [Pythium oligandrum]|uniref:Uncharacterized protein n=1 Tax=Pythium oligandrum TaxID=41045 RepID=A0A8K1CF68_PYTOL|nr:hypothetical protein Poli38472_009588 [Pythium oligandrum]|eukprot:TMW62095.1 hypothetical protein Poli38472_009588 [Pythium oligandrum]
MRQDQVLAVCADEIDAFLDGEERRRLACCSKLLYVTRGGQNGGNSLVTYWQEEATLVETFKTLLSASAPSNGFNRRRRKQPRWRDEQVQPLLRDLVLVGLGIRPSCLVDTCSLDPDHVASLLDAFQGDEPWRSYGLNHVCAILLAGNVFFVQRRAFVRQKTVDSLLSLKNITFVDASAHQQRARFLDEDDNAAIQHLQSELASITHALGASQQRVVLVTTSSPTALAGLLLCYPVVYVVEASSDNCLAMCPLYVIQTSIRRGHDRLVLQEFSMPRHLVSQKDALHGLQRQCLHALERSLRRTRAHQQLTPTVSITTRMLPQVAL